MAKSSTVATVVEKQLPLADKLTPEEQKFFDNSGDDGQGDADAPVVEQPAVVEDAATTIVEDAPAPQQRSAMVPHAALHEEREKRKASDARAKLLEERTNLLLERFAQPQPQQQHVQVQQPQAEEIPSLETDPLGHIVGQIQALAKRQEEFAAATTQRQQQEQYNAAASQIVNRAVAMEQEFARATPDYAEAAAYLQEGRRQEYTALGYEPYQVSQAIQSEAQQIAQQALSRNQNPAEVIYNIARARGFAKAPPAAVGDLPPLVPAQDGAAKIANIASGQQQNRSLGNTRGSAPAPLTAQRLLEMSDKDFDKMLSTPEGKALMGA